MKNKKNKSRGGRGGNRKKRAKGDVAPFDSFNRHMDKLRLKN